jgi:hypothetical protein
MKKLIQTLVVIVTVMATTSNALAQQAATTSSSEVLPIALVPHQDQGTWMVAYLSDQPAVLTVRIFDEQNQLIYKDRFRNEDLSQKAFRLSEMPEGAYTFAVSNPMGEYRETIHYEADPAATALNVEVIPMAGVHRYRLLVMGDTVGELDVKIVGSQEDILFDAPVALDKDHSRIFNLAQVRDDELYFVITSGDVQTVKRVSIR